MLFRNKNKVLRKKSAHRPRECMILEKRVTNQLKKDPKMNNLLTEEAIRGKRHSHRVVHTSMLKEL